MYFYVEMDVQQYLPVQKVIMELVAALPLENTFTPSFRGGRVQDAWLTNHCADHCKLARIGSKSYVLSHG